jgi:CHAD domain-containing protein
MVRLARLLARTALRHIEHPENMDRTEDIHQVRVQCKRLRALMRLFKPVADKDAMAQENARLRDASRALSDFRDAFVAGETLKRVFDDTAARRVQDAAVMLGVTHGGLKRMRNLDTSFRSAAKDLREMVTTLRRLELKARGWEAVAPGLERSYRKAQVSFHKCRKQRTEHLAECFHDWRKRVKDLAYQLEFLENLEPTVVRFWRKEFRKLGTMLGEDHDYVVFAHQVRERERYYEHLATFHPVRKRLRRRLKELREKEFALAGPLLAEPPERWIARMAGLWLRWKNPKLAAAMQAQQAAKAATGAAGAKPAAAVEEGKPVKAPAKRAAKPRGQRAAKAG